MNPNITIRPFDWKDLTPLAQCYARGRIWADEPWNEWKKCPKCPKDKNNFGISFKGKTCPVCDSKLVAFWRIPKVEQDIQIQLSLPQASGFLALKNDKIVGFTWGYPVSIFTTTTIPALNLTLHPRSTLTAVKEGKYQALVSLTITTTEFAYTAGYIDEVGVHPAFRGRGIGTCLTWEIVNYFRSLNLPFAFLRTDSRAKEAITMYERQFFKKDPTLVDPTYEHRRYWVLNLKYSYYKNPRPHYEWERD